MSNLERYKEDLKRLVNLGGLMEKDLSFRNTSKEEKSKFSKETKELEKKLNGLFENEYQEWYTEAIAIIKQLIPDRLSEFISLYQTDPKRKALNSITYSIQDWLNGIRAAINNYSGDKYFDDFASIVMKFHNQTKILKSAQKRFESSLFDLKQIVQAELFDSEIDTAKELNNKGFYRAAGIICGVILEKHLNLVCSNHNVSIRKKNPTISDLNDLIKNNGIIEMPTWRLIQLLGDIRNKCGHNKQNEPTKEDVLELIGGTEKVIKTIF